jgi:hypothetical protein
MISRRNSHIFFYLAVIAVLLGSCSIEKRIYRKGYHVVLAHKKVKELHTPEVVKLKQDVTPEVMASNETKAELIPIKRSPLLVLDKDTCGDKLLLQNADELFVKVIEIDDQSIKYKRCDNLSGPTYSIAKSKVALITYVNGTKEVIQNQAPSYVPTEKKVYNRSEEPPKTNMLGLASLIAHIVVSVGSSAILNPTTAGASVLLLILLWIVAIIMAYVALFQFKNEPGKYKGKWMPVVVIIFNAVGFLLAGLIFTGYGGATGVALILFLLGFLMIGILIAGLLPKPQPTRN